MFDLWLRINENNHVDGINTTKHKEKKMTKENLTDEERAYETYLWEQNLDYSLNLETQATLAREEHLKGLDIYEKNLEGAKEEDFYEEDPNFEYNPTTPIEPVADTIEIDDGIPF